ncbi:hypothetical protein [Geothrix sp. PMB-07]|uniref:hypothetical protein n=1 Tax=Geothrix sp. PMB-07 TaxID=3068640 RepID=UPI002741B9BD|nr:hypothetical protein [Geothrix sp. PMB-07]WLT30745.1 hypothetical protein Q9293_13570 [Geothrix sp. PMB-07]
MRLGTLLLSTALLAPTLSAQGRPRLAWEGLPPLEWQSGDRPQADAPVAVQRSNGPLEARLSGDGTLTLRDVRGIIRLKTGLPGRPLRAWRDGGIPLPVPTGNWGFPVDSPLSQGLGGLQWAAEDFRPFLRGLLWVLEDGEGFLSVVHPATAEIVHLPLPAGRDLRLRFLPDRLEVVAGTVDRGSPAQWSIPWIALLPRLAPLGIRRDPSKAGTALAPFPQG